jgi:hypothetical protein
MTVVKTVIAVSISRFTEQLPLLRLATSTLPVRAGPAFTLSPCSHAFTQQLDAFDDHHPNTFALPKSRPDAWRRELQLKSEKPTLILIHVNRLPLNAAHYSFKCERRMS